MLKRTVEISSQPTRLTMRQRQLTLTRDGVPVASVPCEDLGTLIVDHPQTTYTHAVLRDLATEGASLIVCGEDHLPVGVLLPFSRHCQLVQRIHEQIEATTARKKRIWQQLVRGKISASADVLAPTPGSQHLRALVSQVRSGDPANVEARAAKYFWANWLPNTDRFRREQDGDGINALLNYGYAIVRAILARAIVSAGYCPALGIHHHHRSNPFCLADDLIEPLRPIVDLTVRSLCECGILAIDRQSKEKLLKIMTYTVRCDDTIGPLNVVVHRYVSSFGECLRGESKRLSIPLLDSVVPNKPEDTFLNSGRKSCT